MLPELYFLKPEIAALLRQGDAQLAEIRKAENACFRILTTMLALRMRREGEEPCRETARALLEVYGRIDAEHREHAGQLETMLGRWREFPLITGD